MFPVDQSTTVCVLMLLLAAWSPVSSSSLPVPHVDYTEDPKGVKRNCIPVDCPCGFAPRICEAENGNSTCHRCPPGTHQPRDVSSTRIDIDSQCQRHKICYAALGREVKTVGTACSDTVCQCKWREGYTRVRRFCRQTVSECDAGKEISLLGGFPGFGGFVSCMSCQEGFYKNFVGYNSCLPCSSCNDSNVRQCCTTTNDTVCAESRRVRSAFLVVSVFVGVLVFLIPVAMLMIIAYRVRSFRSQATAIIETCEAHDAINKDSPKPLAKGYKTVQSLKFEEAQPSLAENLKHPDHSLELSMQTPELDLRQRILHLQQKIDETKHQNHILEQRNQQLGIRFNTLHDDAAKLEELQEELNEKNKILTDMAKEKDILEERLSSSLVELAVVTTDLKHVTETMNEYKEELRQSKEKADEYRHKCEETKRELAEVNVHFKCLKSLMEEEHVEDGRSDGDRNPNREVTDDDLVEIETSPVLATANQARKSVACVATGTSETADSFKSVFAGGRDRILSCMQATDFLLMELLERHLLSQQQITCIKAETRNERLLLLLEDCHVDLLPEFYAALTDARQSFIVDVIRQF